MEAAGIDLAEASTTELVDAASAIAAELARRTPPESAAACMELAETLAAAGDLQEAVLAVYQEMLLAGRLEQDETPLRAKA